MNLKIEIPSQLTFDLRKLYVFEKRSVVYLLYVVCFMLLFYGSLHPWFLWPLMDYYKPLAGIVGVLGMIIDNSSEDRCLTRRNVFIPIVLITLFLFTVNFVNGLGIPTYIIETFSVLALLTFLRADDEIMEKAITAVVKITAGFLIFSILFFVAYLIGFPLPHSNAVFGDGQYFYSNYYFFLLDDRDSLLIPRFHSVLLEPGHLAGCTCFLLLTQFGKWKKWYNAVLIISTVITFSLAGYAFLTALIFLNMWVQRKQIVKTMIAVASVVCIGFIGALNYNGGDNMLNDLIVLRMEVDDKTGDIQGNNRVSEDFEKEFDSFLLSPDVLVGRDFQQANDNHGNSGYRVFIYENGLIATILIFVFYFYALKHYKDYRFLVSAIILFFMMFWSRGYPQQYSYLLCIFIAAHQEFKSLTAKPSKDS